MTEHTYALIMDASDSNTNWARTAQYLRDSVWIKGWANHLPAVFFLRSNLGTHDLTPKIQAIVNPARFVLIQMDPRNVNGWMPQPTWDWINNVPTPFDPDWLLPQIPSPGQTYTRTPLETQEMIDALLNPSPPAKGISSLWDSLTTPTPSKTSDGKKKP